MTAPPSPRSVTGLAPVPTWKLTGIPRAWAAAHTASYRSLLYAPSAGACMGSMTDRNPRRATRSISRTDSSGSWTGISAAPANRFDAAANVSASQSLYARAVVHRSSGSGITNANNAIVGYRTSPHTPSSSRSRARRSGSDPPARNPVAVRFCSSESADGGPIRRGGVPSTTNIHRPSTSSMRGARPRRCEGKRCTQRSSGSTTCESALFTSVVTVSLPQDHRAGRRRARTRDHQRDLGSGDLVCGGPPQLAHSLEHVCHAVQVHLGEVAAVRVDRQQTLAPDAAVGDERAALPRLTEPEVLEAHEHEW